MDNKVDNRFNKSVIFGLIAGISIFVIGFGVLLIMYNYWIRTQFVPNLKGLFGYKASALGDSICLPIFIGSMVAYVYYFYTHVNFKYKYQLPILAGGLSAFLGAFIQVTWLLNDNIVPNWSIPKAHHFNYAGWYHAFFFVLIFFLVGYLFTAMFIAEKAIKKESNSSRNFSMEFL